MEGVGDSIRQAMASGRPSRPPLHKILTARDIMATKVVCLRPTHTVEEAIDTLIKHGISGAPVVDAHGRLIGMLSEADCMRDLAACRFHSHGDSRDQPVAALMSTTLTTIHLETDIYTIADLFLRHKLRRLPVLQGGIVIGQVSRRDVLRAMKSLQ